MAFVTSAAVPGPDGLLTKRATHLSDLTEGAEAAARGTTDHVATRLARHLVPREVRFCDALPLTITGKIMRRALKAEMLAEAGA